jgi:hypothetical protein
MQHFLVIYNRREGQIVRRRAYWGAPEALHARFSAEREFTGQPDIEVVVLGGESWLSVQRTHSRYFNSVQDDGPAKQVACVRQPWHPLIGCCKQADQGGGWFS